MKKTLLTLLLMSVLLLSSCASWGFGTNAPTLEAYAAFENDTWLVVGSMLINKTDGTVFLMNADYDARIYGVDMISYHGPYAYKYVFEESSFKEYTYLEALDIRSELGDSITQYYECILTYGYNGAEIEREYIGELISEAQMAELYENNPSNVASFPIKIDTLWKYEDKSEYSQTDLKIIGFAEEIYNSQADEISAVVGVARPVGEEIWFSTVICENGNFETGDALLNGMRGAVIRAYNPVADVSRTVLELDGKNRLFVDFDESGAYIFDSTGSLKYFDFNTKKETLIHRFDGYVMSFELTENYICASYKYGDSGSYFVYEKGGSIIANGEYSSCEPQ